MQIRGIVWLQKIVDKLEWKHQVSQMEVEQTFLNKPQYRFMENGRIDGENVYSAYGCTDSGRYLTVIFILKLGSRALIISARDMDRKERRQYGR